MPRASSLLFLGHLSAFACAQIITVTDPDASSPVACNSTAEECSIAVEGSASSINEFHCPDSSACNKCVLECEFDSACFGSKIYSYECDTVIVSTSTGNNAMFNLDITGPVNGNLYVIVNSSSSNAFRGGVINAPMTQNVNVYVADTTAAHTARSMVVKGQNITGALNITCNGECRLSEITCPVDSVVNDTVDDSSCIVDCSADNDAGCTNMNIYTANGISDVELNCGSLDNECDNTFIHCDLGVECEMLFSSNTSAWSCQGGDCSVYPSDSDILAGMSSTEYLFNYTDDEQEMTTTMQANDDDDTPFYEEKYFIPAAAAAAGVLLLVLLLVVGCCCCKKTCSKCCPCCCSQEEPNFTQTTSQATMLNPHI